MRAAGLDLSHNGIDGGEKTVDALVASSALDSNAMLETVNLSGNSFSLAAAGRLFDSNIGVGTLLLDHNYLFRRNKDKGARAAFAASVASCLESSKHLRELGFGYNDFDDDFVHALSQRRALFAFPYTSR